MENILDFAYVKTRALTCKLVLIKKVYKNQEIRSADNRAGVYFADTIRTFVNVENAKFTFPNGKILEFPKRYLIDCEKIEESIDYLEKEGYKYFLPKF